MPYQPPFTVSSRMIHLIAQISENLGRVDSQGMQASPQLRKQNRIKTITSTLAIEGNTLSMEQVTAIVDGKHVLGEPKELAEVRGAIRAYEKLGDWDATSIDDFLSAHRLLMDEVLRGAGRFRDQGVGIHKGKQVVHVAPPAGRVPALVDDLFSWAKTTDQHPLITSSVVHYELEFIHPFIDGNGRIGRLWHALMLGQWKPIFNLLPLESVIKDRQQRYYDVLEAADGATDSRVFIEFILEAIDHVLEQNIIDVAKDNDTSSDQVKAPQKYRKASQC